MVLVEVDEVEVLVDVLWDVLVLVELVEVDNEVLVLLVDVL